MIDVLDWVILGVSNSFWGFIGDVIPEFSV